MYDSSGTSKSAVISVTLIASGTVIIQKKIYLTAITSISTSTFLGRVFTATAERAGKGAVNTDA